MNTFWVIMLRIVTSDLGANHKVFRDKEHQIQVNTLWVIVLRIATSDAGTNRQVFRDKEHRIQANTNVTEFTNVFR